VLLPKGCHIQHQIDRGMAGAESNRIAAKGVLYSENRHDCILPGTRRFTMSLHMRRGYMLDTNVFNHVLRDGVAPSSLVARGALFATHVQFQELQATRDDDRRKQLIAVFQMIGPNRIPTETSLWDVTPWDEGKWSPDDEFYEHLLVDLGRRNGGKSNNVQDALIAETAIRNCLCLVTGDRDLAEVTRARGDDTLTLRDFLALI